MTVKTGVDATDGEPGIRLIGANAESPEARRDNMGTAIKSGGVRGYPAGGVSDVVLLAYCDAACRNSPKRDKHGRAAARAAHVRLHHRCIPPRPLAPTTSKLVVHTSFSAQARKRVLTPASYLLTPLIPPTPHSPTQNDLTPLPKRSLPALQLEIFTVDTGYVKLGDILGLQVWVTPKKTASEIVMQKGVPVVASAGEGHPWNVVGVEVRGRRRL